MILLSHRNLAVGLLLIVVLAGVGCNKPETRNLTAASSANTVTVTLTYDPACAGTSCTCRQSGSSGNDDTGNLAKVPSGNYVAWKTSNGTPSDIKFNQAGSPPYNPFNEFVNPSVLISPGPVTGNSKDTWNYFSITIGPKTCNNAGSLGIIMM